MKRVLGAIKIASRPQRVIALILTVVFILSAAMTGTSAWVDMSQHKTNTAAGEGEVRLYEAVLQKFERDKDGKETTTAVLGAEFTLYKINADGTAEPVRSFVTGVDGKILATDLLAGDYYWQETRPAVGFLPETEDGQAKKYTFSVPSHDGKTILSSAYNIRQSGALALTKSVENADNSALTQQQKDSVFEFTVNFSDGKGYEYSIDGGTTQTVSSGGKIYLKSGQTAQFTSLPAGLYYEIIETPVQGYTTTSENNAGNIPESGITASFVNTYKEDEPVDKFKLTVKKVVEGSIPEYDKDKLFHFILTINGKGHEFDLKAGEISEEFTVNSGDVYSLREVDYIADGYTQSLVINGAGVVGNKDIEIIQTNTYTGSELIDIAGEKKWTASSATKLPESITILLKNGNVTVRSIKVNKDSGWKYEFRNLPKTDALGNDIHYTISEIRIPGWRPVVNGYNIENINQPSITDTGIEVEKALLGDTPPSDETFRFLLTALGGAPMPEQSEITILGAGKVSFGRITYTLPGTYVYTITEHDARVQNWTYDSSVYTLTVTVNENAAGQLEVSRALTKNGTPCEKVLFTNHYDNSGETTSIRVTKLWKGGGNHPQSVQVQLYKDGTAHGNPVTLSSANDWTRVWSSLAKYADWTVKEVNVPDGYTAAITGDAVNGFVITNTKTGEPDPDKTNVKVTKIWKDDGEHPQSVAVQLYKDGAATGVPVILSQSNSWTYTWTGLEKGSEWKVDEVNVPTGYSKTVSGDAANGFVITNTKTDDDTPEPNDEEITISGKKTWNHGNNPIAKRPEYIVVIIKANDIIVTQRQISAKEHWNWSFRLPKYDGNNKEIVYTVDEARFEDYVKTVDGYSLINTYSPGSSTDDPNPGNPGDPNYPGTDRPKTDDENHIALWIALMLISLITIIIMLKPWKRKWNGKQYVAKY